MEEIGGRIISPGPDEHKVVHNEHPVSADSIKSGNPGWAILVAYNDRNQPYCGLSPKGLLP